MSYSELGEERVGSPRITHTVVGAVGDGHRALLGCRGALVRVEIELHPIVSAVDGEHSVVGDEAGVFESNLAVGLDFKLLVEVGVEQAVWAFGGEP